MTYRQARKAFGIRGLPDCLAPYYEEAPAQPVMDRAWLAEQLARYGVTGTNAEALVSALDALERNEPLAAFTNFIIAQMCVRHIRLDPEYVDLRSCRALPESARAFYPLLVMLGCVVPAEEACRRRGIADAAFRPTVEHMLRAVLGRYARTGKPRVNFEWESGFMTCALLRFGRFYFAPHRYDEPITILKNRRTGAVTALLPDEDNVVIRASDGQYDGIAGWHDPDTFRACRSDTDTAYIGHPIDPAGIGLPTAAEFPKCDWEQTVQEGDAFLALHIPGGEGYDPEHLRESASAAVAFYDRYFPELSIRGIWSESWLYDPHLRAVLPPDSKILRMQRQMYCMPFPDGEPTIHGELIPHTPPTALERAVTAYEAAGGTFSTNFLFILREDILRIGMTERLYGTE